MSHLGAWEEAAHVVLNSPGREDGCFSVLDSMAGQPPWVALLFCLIIPVVTSASAWAVELAPEVPGFGAFRQM